MSRRSSKRKRDENPELKEETKLSLSSDSINHSNTQANYWLMKSEPESRIENGHEMKFGLDDLKASKDQITHWDGVRNYEARNQMKTMKLGELAFFYHSNCKTPGIIGIMKICREAYVDHTQFDQNDPHYDPKSDKTNPKWEMVDVKFERDLKRFIPLQELKHYHLLHKKEGKEL